MSLQDLLIPSVLDTSNHDLSRDFFEPILRTAKHYDRAVGFFSAAWLRINANGMTAFARSGGHARWITSPILSEADWQALLEGNDGRNDLRIQAALRQNIRDLQEALEENTLSALAWLVADGVLSFKLALPRNKLSDGEFHAKFGIFTDTEGAQLGFNGSYNDSVQGTLNYENIHVFKSWESTEPFVASLRDKFERLWFNLDPNVKVFDIPAAAKAEILKLRTQDRPYPKSQNDSQSTTPSPHIPQSIKLRTYQEQAIMAWFEHDCQGLLEMATGTGKTITSLAAAVKLFEREGRLALIISVPYQHLVDQWSKEAGLFSFQPILAYVSKKRWLKPLNDAISDFNAGYASSVVVITTHTTFTDDDFQKCMARVNTPSLILADEAHHLGAERSRVAYPHHIPNRLALSATPDRWFDDEGTNALRAYFGSTVFEFTLEQAIGVSLTPYYYYPHLVSLTDEEMEAYEELTNKLAKLMGKEDQKSQDILQQLLIKRANLMNRAANKLTLLSSLIDEQTSVKHALFYCAPKQIDDVMRLVGYEKGLLVSRFTAQESAKERRNLLQQFAEAELDALVAMKCLDEGVDVPSTRTAFFLASSSNPREFVQRRGRILRKYPGKEHSVIYDLIAVPPDTVGGSTSFNAERSIIRRELARFKEFANLANNKNQAIDVIWSVAKQYGLMDF